MQRIVFEAVGEVFIGCVMAFFKGFLCQLIKLTLVSETFVLRGLISGQISGQISDYGGWNGGGLCGCVDCTEQAS